MAKKSEFTGFDLDKMGFDPEEKASEQENAQEKGGEPSLLDLQKQLDALMKQNQELQKANFALMAQAPAPQTPVAPPETPQIDLKDLPNPISDPDGYTRELTARLAKAYSGYSSAQAAYLQQQAEAQRQAAEKAEALWNEFRTKYPELKDKTGRVEYIAGKVAKNAKARGINIDKYVFGASEQFFHDIVEEYKREFGDFTAEKTKEKDTQESETDENSGRSTTVFGGQVSQKAASGKKAEDDSPGDMVAEIMEVQRKSGFF